MHASVFRRWLLTIAGLGLAACGGGPSVALLELDTSGGVIDLGIVERGSDVSIEGKGFPVGGAGTLRLLGTVHAPGRRPRRVEGAVAASAVTGDQLVVKSDALIDQLGGSGTFEGRLRVEFRALTGDATLTAEQPALVDLSAQSVREQHALRGRALSVLEQLGIEVSQDETTHDGVTVSHTVKGSHAARLGVQAGDVIDRASGVRVHALGDVVPPPLSSQLELHLERPTLGAVVVHLPLDASVETSALPLGRLAVLIGFALGLFLAFGSRESLAGRALRSLLTALRSRPEPSALGVFGADPPPPQGRRTRVLLAMVASVCGVMLVCFEPAGFLSVRSITLYLPIVAVGVALAAMRRGRTVKERGRDALALLGRMSAMGAVLASACALSGTRALDGIVAPQGAWPWQWGFVQHPGLLAALPLFWVYGAQIGDAEPEGPRGSRMAQRAMTAERVLTNVVLAAFGAAIFFGGWQSPLWLTLGPWPERLPGALLFVLKAWAVAFALASARRSGVALRKRTTLGLCATLVVLTAAEVVFEPSASVVRFTGETFGVALLSAAGLALGQRLFTARSRRPALSIAFGAK